MCKLRLKDNQKKLLIRIAIIAYFFTVVFLLGCSEKFFVKSEKELSNVKSIAVLPFENFASDAHAGEKVRRIVITDLLSRGINVIEPGEVTRLLIEMKVGSLSSIKTKEIQDLGKKLGVEAVMCGSVEAFGISSGISVSYPEVTINLMMIETSTGNIIWSVRNSSGGASFWTRHFGTEGITLSEAARNVVRESLNTGF
jgi:TolB-like protein